MCQTLEVSKSGYYAAQKRPESKRVLTRGILAEKIKLIHANSRNTYGSARVHAVLLENTERCSRPLVASIMRDHGLAGKRKGKIRQITTDSTHGHAIAENRLDREFDAEKPNQKWVADITYLPTTEGWLYLAAVLDLHSRRVVGWSMSDSLESQVVLDALEMARISRKPSAGLVYHSDRGVQYAASVHRAALERIGAVTSMSRKGNCWDNAVAESFFGTLKCELDLAKAIGSKVQTRAAVFEWIEVWYNRERRHSSLGFLSPVMFEERFDTLFCSSTNT
jgi:putative transposase